jgi:Zn ribbon nucleic-acid-binding protein
VTETVICKHGKTRLIAKDNEAEYVECVVCGAILETHELVDRADSSTSQTASPDNQKRAIFDESLSDA